ncbi:MAG: hypothetical protein RRB13_12425 [bacterium]|nr:hypothetical protein [bacterium]
MNIQKITLFGFLMASLVTQTALAQDTAAPAQAAAASLGSEKRYSDVMIYSPSHGGTGGVVETTQTQGRIEIAISAFANIRSVSINQQKQTTQQPSFATYSVPYSIGKGAQTIEVEVITDQGTYRQRFELKTPTPVEPETEKTVKKPWELVALAGLGSESTSLDIDGTNFDSTSGTYTFYSVAPVYNLFAKDLRFSGLLYSRSPAEGKSTGLTSADVTWNQPWGFAGFTINQIKVDGASAENQNLIRGGTERTFWKGVDTALEARYVTKGFEGGETSSGYYLKAENTHLLDKKRYGYHLGLENESYSKASVSKSALFFGGFFGYQYTERGSFSASYKNKNWSNSGSGLSANYSLSTTDLGWLQHLTWGPEHYGAFNWISRTYTASGSNQSTVTATITSLQASYLYLF